MKGMTKADLKPLMEKQTGFCVSLYLPTHRALPESNQDPIRFKNLLTDAERRLIDGGLDSTETNELLKRAQKLLGDNDFWRHQSDGLAVFISPDTFVQYRLPISFSELAVVGKRFHLKPLLRMLNEGHFYILALSKNEVRLLQASRFHAENIPIENLPEGLADVLGQYDFEKQLQFHTSAPATGGNRAALFHGHGAGDGAQKEKIAQYFRRIDAAICDTLKDEKSPMIFAGVEQLFPLYKETNSYPNLMEQYIPGNPETLDAVQLQETAWKIAQPFFAESQKDAEAKYRTLAGTGLTETRIEEVITAACHGRVESLFAAEGFQCWGHFDPESNQVRLHNKPQANSEDLLDLAALKTIEASGDVFIVDRAKVPGGQMAAAVFRY